ncbi:MAG: hypothetical protein IT562_17700 [Alphaproteobacteria bacterium]|nr:hypothetical protein [Alphaproteobacteria bacterium]
MSERIHLSLSPTGANPAGSARVTAELIAFHRARGHALRSEAFACWARGLWRWATGRAAVASIGDCGDRAWAAPRLVRG